MHMDVVTANPEDWDFNPFFLTVDGDKLQANEENSSIAGIGVDMLVKDGLLDKFKKGPLFWIDTADKQPCIGTGGMVSWNLHATGMLFHSGLAHKVPQFTPLYNKKFPANLV
ncbi:acetylornithine deacetylase [Thalictrum thalictroides]|uniref:Acetylornithine deacetylase n=1 Tax=Thalictrum thalictroides TaxID=46969 RepID=A0A7J6V4C9_THATH|nr:acetylornithine deacetylase [Thalictrum thalictroides]